jgi:pimeloyl-ACP methyl ester carboxylesterase
VTADGTGLFHHDWGTGHPVVFVAGWTLCADFWEYQMAPLSSRGMRCVGYDRRGHGRSACTGGGYDFDTLADDLAAVIDGLDLRAATLVGHSMGAAEIVRYLSRHGARRVARVLLVAPTTPFLLKTADNTDGIDASLFARVRADLTRDRPRWLAEGAPGFFGMPENEVSAELRQWGLGLSLQTSMKA